MDTIKLKKYHGLGNDYLVLDPNKNEIQLQPRNIEMLCRRNFGVGADGILYGPICEPGKIRVLIYNPDGSKAERSGNGVRIFAKYLLDEGYVTEKKFNLTTESGDVEIEFLDQKGESMRVNMGKPSFVSDTIPVNGILDQEVVNEPLSFHDSFYNTTCLTVGNPNCVIMMEEISSQKAVDLGPYVESASYFPNRTNMQLLKVLDRNNIQIEIYERGAGYTLASGTGACAAAAAARRMGLVDDTVTVHMPGGELIIEILADETIFMTGTVGYVGEFILAENFFS
jgi:diaminopimelate epimerase